MSKRLKTLPASTPDPKGVFGQGAKALRVGLYARVSTHDQKTLPLQFATMRDYAEKRSWTIVVEVQDVGSGATTRPQREALRSKRFVPPLQRADAGWYLHRGLYSPQSKSAG